MDRRDFLKMMGVASGASALAGCDLDRNSEKLIPYLVPPDDGEIPGDATFVTTSCTECPAQCGVTARVREGRPVKVDGLENHPVNDGALCVRGQASLNRLYHTERIRQPLMKDDTGNLVPATWDEALARVAGAMAGGGEHVFLSGRTSGSFSALVDDFCGALGVSRLPEFELFSYAAVREANLRVLGHKVLPTYRIDRADFLFTLGADVTETFGNPVYNVGAISERLTSESHFKWYHAEPHASLTGFQAAQRLRVRPGSEAHLIAYLLNELRDRRIFTNRRIETQVASVPSVSAADAAQATGVAQDRLEKLATDFMAAHHPLVIAGGVSTTGDNGFDLAQLTAILQAAAGMINSTVDITHATDYSGVGSMADVTALSQRLDRGRMGVAFVVGTDPVSRLAEGGAFATSLRRARAVVGVADTLTPTMQLCDIVFPVSHALESWGDTEPRVGIVGVIQPAFAPLFDTRSDGDILLSIMAMLGRPVPVATYQDYVMARWNQAYGAGAAREMIERGFTEVSVNSKTPVISDEAPTYTFDRAGAASGATLFVAPSVRWYDGRSADLPLLREIPDPLTTVTWDEWVSVATDWARDNSVSDRDEVEISSSGWSARLPVRIQPGLGRDTFVIHHGAAAPPMGWTRKSGEANTMLAGVSVQRTGTRRKIPILAGSLYEEGRGAVPGNHPAHFGHGGATTEHEGNGHGEEAKKHDRRDETFYPEPDYPDYRWSMAIDLDLCTGCSACVAACYVENNVPMTGRDEHLKGREMAWIRIEPYYDEEDNADFVPAMCQHCDYAPCEPVCPVFATYHNDEGLNAQIYNRCVGTRYCANNCPYKQRRFNWFAWNDRPEPLNLMVNPDVSVRGKGIMEKCSMCVQRIRKARDVAKDEGRQIQEGDLTTACAQACPGNAIVFGNLKDENAAVTKWAHSERATRLLDELGAGPGVFYLSKKGNDHDA